ncbi:MAG: protein translocase subunit SecF [Patescibacteria group bacterium]|nr:protein translocase subunit SecF [Patescibacteria group bacterium]
MNSIKWTKLNWLFFTVSALFILPGVYSLIRWGLKPSVDFTGGTLLEISADGLNRQEVTELIEGKGLGLKSIQSSGDRSLLLRFDSLEEASKNELLSSIGENYGNLPEVVRWEFLGPALGQELLTKTGISILLAVLVVLIYINFQFKEKAFGICAILAMLHDSLILLGSFSLLGRFFGVEVDSLFVTAVLTILSFSVHDTVVVYDRIRELSRINPKMAFEEISDLAVSQTLVRSINNSLTIIFMLIALVWLGGETIRNFTLALLIGTVAGTYSSTFTAVPLLVVWKKIFKRK